MHNARMETLEQRHSHLDRQIAAQVRKPASDDLEIAHLKRERLSLKDQLVSLQA